MKWWTERKQRRIDNCPICRAEWELAEASAELLELEATLDALYLKAKDRKSHDKFNAYLDFTEFLNSTDKLQWSILAEKHFYLCQKLKQFGRQFKYFNKTRDVGRGEPTPPEAYIKVTDDKAVKHTLEYNEDRTLVRRLVDGKPEGQYGSDDGWVDATRHYINPQRREVEELTGRSFDELFEEWKRDNPRDQWSIQDYFRKKEQRENA